MTAALGARPAFREANSAGRDPQVIKPDLMRRPARFHDAEQSLVVQVLGEEHLYEEWVAQGWQGSRSGEAMNEQLSPAAGYLKHATVGSRRLTPTGRQRRVPPPSDDRGCGRSVPDLLSTIRREGP